MNNVYLKFPAKEDKDKSIEKYKSIYEPFMYKNIKRSK